MDVRDKIPGYNNEKKRDWEKIVLISIVVCSIIFVGFLIGALLT